MLPILKLPISCFFEQITNKKPKQLTVVINKPTPRSSVAASGAKKPSMFDKIKAKSKPKYEKFVSKFSVLDVAKFQHGYHAASNYGRALYVTIALFANDAVACFDRMVPNLSTLVAMKHGVKPNVMIARNKVMQAMEHQVRTQCGDSKATYKEESGDDKLAGETQGKGNVASLWSILSHTLLKAHKELHQGIVLPHVSNKKLAIRKNNDSFVDDTDAMAARKGSTFYSREKQTVAHLARGALIWAILIMATGGAIAYHKSKWQILSWIDYTFPPRPRVMSTQDITLEDSHGAESTIGKLRIDEPNKGLGCLHAPLGNQEPEFKHRLKQCQELASKARISRFTIRECYDALNGRIMPKTTYSFPTTTFSTKQCKDLNTAIDGAMVNKLRLNRHMPKVVLYAPLSKGGVNYPLYQIKQDQKGLLTMLKHFRWNGTVGADMLVVLSAVQLVSGLCEPILEGVDTKLPYMDNGWFMHNRSRLQALNGKMWIEHQWTPPLRRAGDQSIMKAFTTIPGVSKKRLINANFCRLWMKVITIADLANIKGNLIPGNRLNGKWQSKSDLTWTNLPCPTAKCWADFRWCVYRTFVTERRLTRLSKPIHLDAPLGSWRQVKHHIPSTMYRTELYAFNKFRHQYLQYKWDPTLWLFKSDGATNEFPRDAHPIEAQYNEHELWTTHQFRTIRDHVPPTQSAIEIVTAVEGPDMAGSDGSVERRTGDRACAACVQVNGTRYSTSVRYPPSNLATSYRSELKGIYHTLQINKEVGAPSTIEQYVDNQQAIKSITTKFKSAHQMLSADADIILACKHLQQRWKCQLDLKWIKAHQSDTTDESLMTPSARLNDDMDELAKDARLNKTPIEFQPYPGSGAMLCINDKWITSRYEEEIHTAANLGVHKKFFLKKYKDKTIDHYNVINWDGIGIARKKLKDNENINLAKYMNGWLHSGRQKGLYGDSPECPCCGWHEETQLHMFQCTRPDMRRNRHTAFKSLEKYYHQYHIPAMVYKPFIRMCKATCEMEEPNFGQLPPAIYQAITEQQRLGGEFTLRGYLTGDWLTALQSQGVKRAEQKLSQLYLGLWRVLFQSIWDKRNDIAHGNDSIVTRVEREQYMKELQQWQMLSASRLGVNQQYLIDYTDHDLSQWTNSAMKLTLQLLVRAAKNFRTAQQTEGQQLITEYFQPLTENE